MPRTRQPKFDEVIDGVRVRVYATRTDYECVYDDDVNDPAAVVVLFPKMGDPTTAPAAWAHQARLEYASHKPTGNKETT